MKNPHAMKFSQASNHLSKNIPYIFLFHIEAFISMIGNFFFQVTTICKLHYNTKFLETGTIAIWWVSHKMLVYNQ